MTERGERDPSSDPFAPFNASRVSPYRFAFLYALTNCLAKLVVGLRSKKSPLASRKLISTRALGANDTHDCAYPFGCGPVAAGNHDANNIYVRAGRGWIRVCDNDVPSLAPISDHKLQVNLCLFRARNDDESRQALTQFFNYLLALPEIFARIHKDLFNPLQLARRTVFDGRILSRSPIRDKDKQ
jgi:hypothetical protein